MKERLDKLYVSLNKKKNFSQLAKLQIYARTAIEEEWLEQIENEIIRLENLIDQI